MVNGARLRVLSRRGSPVQIRSSASNSRFGLSSIFTPGMHDPAHFHHYARRLELALKSLKKDVTVLPVNRNIIRECIRLGEGLSNFIFITALNLMGHMYKLVPENNQQPKLRIRLQD